MQKTNINPEIFQAMLDCAPNAAAKGQSQFFTPTDFGRSVALPLPRHRPVIVDLNCGAGHLLSAAANQTTQHALGSDIDPCSHNALRISGDSRLRVSMHRMAADATLLYPLLAEVDWRADLWVLNPPWDLHFWRERLAFLAESEFPSVRTAFAAHDGRTAKGTGTSGGTIDSTIAMLLIALDRSSYSGEGLLIANNATLERLIFAPGAPHGALARHIWARVIVEGNPMTDSSRSQWEGGTSAQTAAIYFARDHETGLRPTSDLRSPTSDPTAICQSLATRRDSVRQGARVTDSWQTCRDTVPLWTAVASEWTARNDPTAGPAGTAGPARTRTDYNLWLTASGEIKTNLSLFDQRSASVGRTQRILKDQAAQLHSLDGRRPMELVLQRSQRELLLRQCNLPISSEQIAHSKKEVPLAPWRVDPKLQEAVQAAMREYHACRAPLYPLPGLQRLGYLEEEDIITCKVDLYPSNSSDSPDPSEISNLKSEIPTRPPISDHRPCISDLPTPIFKADRSYPLTTQSVLVTRTGHKPNLAGEIEEVEYSGSELATYITDETGSARCFMESRLRDQHVCIDGYPAANKIDFTLQELDAHFIVPEVPDIAAVHSEAFRRNLDLLFQIERVCTS